MINVGNDTEISNFLHIHSGRKIKENNGFYQYKNRRLKNFVWTSALFLQQALIFLNGKIPLLCKALIIPIKINNNLFYL
ncbi:MAG: hypothetical protein EA341_09750 [Mongoliibacter sp.]|nr:MAG: hypothetical protein EA341_09750 [Mongoliibacter sp.]